ncbi:MAG: FHA domain-containing protein [Deltaproteobacteria bacterium]
MIKVFIANGAEQGRSFVLRGDTALVGRGLANEICLNESSVSRKHAKIYKKNDQYYIEDLQSTNGTWVDGSFIKCGVRVLVEEGIPIAVGNIVVSLGKKCSTNRLPDQYSIVF